MVHSCDEALLPLFPEHALQNNCLNAARLPPRDPGRAVMGREESPGSLGQDTLTITCQAGKLDKSVLVPLVKFLAVVAQKLKLLFV